MGGSARRTSNAYTVHTLAGDVDGVGQTKGDLERTKCGESLEILHAIRCFR